MTRRRMCLIVGALALMTVGGFLLFTSHFSLLTAHSRAPRATYYCPMHPTYTSDRPGACPICNMTLVKREPSAPAAGKDGVAESLRSICYLHNCPRMHEGQPCPMTVVAKQGEKVTCPICGTHIAEAKAGAPGKRVLYWTDPMLPGYKADKPGKSPMGMDLVPVYAEDAGPIPSENAPSGYAPVLLTPQKRQLIGVRTAPVERRALTQTIRTAGRIAYDPSLYQAEQEYLQAFSGMLEAYASPNAEVIQQAQHLVGASRIRLRLMGLSEEFISGMTSWAGPDARLLGTDPSGEVWLYAPVYEMDLSHVVVGQTVLVEAPTLPGQTLEGLIRSMDPVLDPTTRTAKLRAVLRNPGGALKPEMYVNASIRVELGEVLAVPESAVFATGTRSLVFVDKGEGVFEPREVTLGAKADDWDELKAGVAQGERVVTSGNFLMDSESRLKAALESATEEHHHGP